MLCIVIVFFFLIKTSISFAGDENKNRLHIATSNLPKSFYPLSVMTTESLYTLGFALRPLTNYNSKNELICLLCASLPTTESQTIKEISPGQSEVIFTLGTYFWGDGKPVTSEDIIFTWQVGKHHGYDFPNAGFYRHDIISIEALSDKTIKITRNKSSLHAADFSDFWILPAHLERPLFEKNPDLYLKETNYHQNPLLPGLYNGPYIITQFNAYGLIEFKPNPYWHQTEQHPLFSKITLKSIQDGHALEMHVLNNEFDLIAPSNRLQNSQIKTIINQLQETFTIDTTPALGQEMIMINTTNTLLSDKRVRRALLLALDREKIKQVVQNSKAEIAEMYLSSLERTDIPKNITKVNQTGAKKLIEAAGFTFNPKSKIYEKDGLPLRLTLVLESNNRLRNQIAQILQSMWGEVGIDIKITTEPHRTFFGQILKERRFDHLLFIGWPKTPHYIPGSMFSSKSIPNEMNQYTGYNYMGFANANIDNLLQKLEQSQNENDEKTLWSDLEESLADEVPFIPLFHPVKTEIRKKRLEGITVNPHYYPESFFVEKWFFTE